MSKTKIALTVEDSPTQALNLNLMLSQHGLVVVSARSGEEGFEKAKSYMPDFIVLDVELPGMNGFQLCKMLRENKQTTKIPIILLTTMNLDAGYLGSYINSVEHIYKDENAYQKLLEILKAKEYID